MSQREYAEDTVFWSLKEAEQFSARRRTLDLFVLNATAPHGLSRYNWIDNTPQLWTSLKEVLESHNPRAIAINADADISFSSGLHAGEAAKIVREVRLKWAHKFVVKPMIAVEFVGTMPEGQLEWYRRLQETAWAMIEEAFSERVVVPGETHTGVSNVLLFMTCMVLS